MAEKVDFKKSLKSLYDPKARGFHLVNVPALHFLMVDGCGNPNTSLEYQEAMQALYALSYGLKFFYKIAGKDHVVPPLEGLWWMDDMSEFSLENKDRWKWTAMIMQPDWVTQEAVDQVQGEAISKKKMLPGQAVRFEIFAEGQSVQVLYTGAYSDEAPTIAEMHRFIAMNGYQVNGKHHEIYLGDPRKTPPEKLHTIIRQPIRKA